MSKFVIIADSSCDLNKEQRERYGIADYVPGMLTHPDGRDEEANLDWENISYEEFYRSMKEEKALYKTATPTPAAFREKFEKQLKEGKDVLYISLSSGLSGTYNLALLTVAQLNEEYENKVYVIDSLKYSGGIAMLLIKANQLREEGKTIEETVEVIKEMRFNLHQIGPMDDLFFQKRMGRIPAAAAFMGTLISLKPMADFNRNGISHVIGKVKGTKKALKAAVNYVKSLIVDPEEQKLIVNNPMREEQAIMLKNMIEEEIKPKAIEMIHVGQSCGATVGPGLVAVYFFGQSLSEDMEKEKMILAEASK